jgi:tetratricopeptide (TPR) repeat protein
VAIVLNNLANVLSDAGDFAAARGVCEKALAIREKQLGREHADVASTLNNLGTIFRNLEEFDEALRVLRRSLAIEEKVKGPDHLDVARPLGNLALVLKDMGKPEEGIPYVERALRIREHSLPEGHPLVAQTLNNLARVRLAAGDLALARDAAERARSIFDKTLPAGHPSLAVIRHSLGKIYLAENRLDDAEASLREALAIATSTLGVDHPLHGEILVDLATVSLRKGDRRAAFEQAIAAEGAEAAPSASTARSLASEMLEYGDPAPSALDPALSAGRRWGAADPDDASVGRGGGDRIARARAHEIARRHAAARAAEDPATRLAVERLARATVWRGWPCRPPTRNGPRPFSRRSGSLPQTRRGASGGSAIALKGIRSTPACGRFVGGCRRMPRSSGSSATIGIPTGRPGLASRSRRWRHRTWPSCCRQGIQVRGSSCSALHVTWTRRSESGGPKRPPIPAVRPRGRRHRRSACAPPGSGLAA